MLQELTKSLLASIHSKEDFLSFVDHKVGDAPHGLYVFLFANDSDEVVHDNYGKVAVHPGGLTLRPGKFENGCRARFSAYYRDVHRKGPGGAKASALLDCLRSCYVLTGLPKPAPVLEKADWEKPIHGFLQKHGLLAEKTGELRYLHPGCWTSEVDGLFRAYVRELADNIGAGEP